MTPLLLDIVVKTTVILALAAVGDTLLRRGGSAAARHLVWTMAIVGLLALPMAALAVPRWTVTIPLASATARVASDESLRPDSAFRADSSVRPKAEATYHRAPESVAAAAFARKNGASANDGNAHAAIAGALAIAYVAGVLLLLTRLVVEPFALRRLTRASRGMTDPAWRSLLADAEHELGLRATVRLLRSPREIMPLTFGTLSPAIVLPASSDAWTGERRRAVLLHELAHIARRDCVVQQATALACAFYWPHPGVWWAARRLRVERELACDDRVLATGAGPREYAGHLLELAHSLGSAPAPATALGMARPRQLESRLLAILDAARNRAALRPRGRTIALTLALTVVIPLAALRAAVVPRDAAAGPFFRAAATASAFTQTAMAQPSDLSGTWDLRLSRAPGMAQVTVRTARGSHGRSVRLDQLPIAAEQISATSATVNVPFRREAGTFNVEGVCRRGVCGGTFTFEGSQPFAAELVKRGLARPTPEQQMDLAIADVGIGFLDDLSKAGYAKPDLPTLIRAVQHGVGAEYVREMGTLGYRAGSLDALIRLRDHGIDPGYIRGMADNGFARLTIDELLAARDHGVDPEYIKGMRDAGFRQADLASLLDTRNHGVDPAYIRGMQAHGYRLTLDELLSTRNHGIDPEYIDGLASLGYKGLTVDALVQARNHGVDPEYIRSLADVGYKNEPLETLIKMRNHGVDADYIRRVQQKGLGHLSVDELIQRRDHGLDASNP